MGYFLLFYSISFMLIYHCMLLFVELFYDDNCKILLRYLFNDVLLYHNHYKIHSYYSKIFQNIADYLHDFLFQTCYNNKLNENIKKRYKKKI
jgi:hypothetical protein